MADAAKRRIEVELDEVLLQRAEDAGVDLTEAIEGALRRRLSSFSDEEWARWNEDNRAGIEAMNEYVARHGLPLAKYRRF